MFNVIFESISVILRQSVHLSVPFLEFFSPVLCSIFFPRHRLLSHITIVDTTDSCERGMNPVTMSIIGPPKEYWQSRGSNKQPLVLKPTTLTTEPWGSASLILMNFAQIGNQILDQHNQLLLKQHDGQNYQSMSRWREIVDSKRLKSCNDTHWASGINPLQHRSFSDH